MFRSNKNEAMLRMVEMLSLLYALMGSTKLVDVVWVEIFHTGLLPILSSMMYESLVISILSLSSIKKTLHKNGSDK